MTLEQLEEEAKARAEGIIGAWPDGKKKPTGMTLEITNKYKELYKEIEALIKTMHTDVLSGLNKDEYMAEMLKYDRLDKLIKEVDALYNKYALSAGSVQIEASKLGMSNVYYDNMYSINQFADKTEKPYFTTIDAIALGVAVYGFAKMSDQIKKKDIPKYQKLDPKYGSLGEVLKSNRTKDQLTINRIITQAIKQGDPYTTTVKELQRVLNISANNAWRIARTEGNRLMNSGAYLNSIESVKAGVDLKRRYIATLDNRTRPQSSSMDGQEVEIDEPFVYPPAKGYPNGATSFIVGDSGIAEFDCNDRCSSIDIIEGLEPTVRTQKLPGGKSEIISYKNHPQWMNDNGLKYNKSGRMVNK